MSYRRSPLWTRWLTALCFVILYLPLIVLALLSFLKRDIETGQYTATLQWYGEALSRSDLRAALWVSFQVAFGCMIGSVLLGTTAALALERKNFRFKSTLDAITLVPLVVPEIVFGIALLIWFVFLQISLGVLSMTLAHITFSFTYVVVTVRTRLAGLDPSLEEAARDLGASPWQTFYRVTLPLIAPGVISGALMAFTLSFDDFLISFFTAGVSSDTLPMKLYSMIKFGISPAVHALSTLLLFATILMILLVFRPFRRDDTSKG